MALSDFLPGGRHGVMSWADALQIITQSKFFGIGKIIEKKVEEKAQSTLIEAGGFNAQAERLFLTLEGMLGRIDPLIIEKEIPPEELAAYLKFLNSLTSAEAAIVMEALGLKESDVEFEIPIQVPKYDRDGNQTGTKTERKKLRMPTNQRGRITMTGIGRYILRHIAVPGTPPTMREPSEDEKQARIDEIISVLRHSKALSNTEDKAKEAVEITREKFHAFETVLHHRFARWVDGNQAVDQVLADSEVVEAARKVVEAKSRKERREFQEEYQILFRNKILALRQAGPGTTVKRGLKGRHKVVLTLGIIFLLVLPLLIALA